jgi:D-glycerate 3-kinase
MFLSRSAQAELIAADHLPSEFAEQVATLWGPLGERIIGEHAARGGTLVVGLCGPQGSGKSTGARVLEAGLAEAGLRATVLSLDDIYLSRTDRQRLATMVGSPLFTTRGPPGTHDVNLGFAVLDALARSGPVRLPRFDKATDDPLDPATWPMVEGPVDVVLFEGWCVGAWAQPKADLDDPINALEMAEDSQGRWRLYANERLEGSYRELFERIDLLIQLRAPTFATVHGWRLEQEYKLRARTGGGMTDTEIARFIQHYERLTRWIDAEMPARADVVVQLDEDRRPVRIAAADA